MTVYIRCEVAYGGADAVVECAAVRQMSPKTHPCSADAAVAGRNREKSGDGEGSVFVVGRHFLLPK